VTPEELAQIRNSQNLLRQDIANLQRLMQEFSSELTMLGADVEQIKRNLAALEERVTNVERTVANLPKISATMNLGFRGEAVSFLRGAPAGITSHDDGLGPFATDRDNRFVQRSKSYLEPIRELYDMDLGITANIGDIATARLLLNAGNYVNGYLNGGVSTASPVLGTFNSFVPTLFERVTPWFMYLDFPIKLGGGGHEKKKEGDPGIGLDVTVGKFGHQFTPYTLRMVDTDSYFTNDKTDLGSYPIAGGRVALHHKNLSLALYGGVHHNNEVVPSSTAGLAAIGVLGGPGPFADFVGAEWNTTISVLMDQSMGVRATYDTPRFSLGTTYLTGATNTNVSGPISNVFRQLDVLGADVKIPLFGRLSAQAEWARSEWHSQAGGGVNGGINRNAIDARLNVPIGSNGLLQGFWKDIGAGFDAPGSWGRMGRWWNYRGVEGPGGTITLPLGRLLTLDGEGAHYNLSGILPTGGSVNYLRANLGIKITPKDHFSVGYERVAYFWDKRPAPPFIDDELEQYYNAGWQHSFSPTFGMRLFYQLMNAHQSNVLTTTGTDFQTGFVGSQFTVRY
jgi:hypothetical protein